MGKQKNLSTKSAHEPSKSDALIDFLARRGVIADENIDSEKVRAARAEKQRMMFHNTRLLLENYRNIAWTLECFPDTVADELEQPFESLDTLLDRVDAEVGMGNRKLEGRMESVRKSRLLLDRINEALSVLKRKPGNGEKLYELIYLTYIAPDKLTHTFALSARPLLAALLPAARTGHPNHLAPALVGAQQRGRRVARGAHALRGHGVKTKWQKNGRSPADDMQS